MCKKIQEWLGFFYFKEYVCKYAEWKWDNYIFAYNTFTNVATVPS